VLVVVKHELRKSALEIAATGDQHSIEALAPDGTHGGAAPAASLPTRSSETLRIRHTVR
jgi:hypothetical protein